MTKHAQETHINHKVQAHSAVMICDVHLRVAQPPCISIALLHILRVHQARPVMADGVLLRLSIRCAAT